MRDTVTLAARPLVVHLVYRLDFGGLEMLLVELVNRMPAERFRHAVICLTDYTEFSKKITQPDVALYALHKPPGWALGTHRTLWRLLRQLRPAILHTYNLSALEYGFTAALAGVPTRVHGEHGRDASDPHGTNRKHNLLRKLLLPFFDCYYAVSQDLHDWLRNVIGVPDRKNLLLGNGIDTLKFQPAAAGAARAPGLHGLPPDAFVIGTVGRIQDVKDQSGLIDAFIALRALLPQHAARLHLAIVGDGPLLPALRKKAAAAGIADHVWLPGARHDIADLMRSFSLFALPSIAEGTPLTILEAMASALPVVATRVGGIPEVVIEQETGTLVPPSDAQALAHALAAYVESPELLARHGAAGRARIEQHYAMSAMIGAYTAMYDRMSSTNTAILGRK